MTAAAAARLNARLSKNFITGTPAASMGQGRARRAASVGHKHLKTQEHSTHTSSPHRLEAVWVLQQRLEGAHQLAVQAPEEAQQALDDVRHEQRLRGAGGGAGSGGRAGIGGAEGRTQPAARCARAPLRRKTPRSQQASPPRQTAPPTCPWWRCCPPGPPRELAWPRDGFPRLVGPIRGSKRPRIVPGGG